METRIVEELLVDDAAGIAGQAHLSAASGLVKVGNQLSVVADDEHHLARKAAKPDCEALLVQPAFKGYPQGALAAMGSGSRPSR